MKLISDIRLYKSEYESTEKMNPKGFASKKQNAIVTRIVMKLRENGFTLSEDYDHLYMNYTYSLPIGEVKIGKHLMIKEFSWFQYCDAGIAEGDYEHLDEDKYTSLLLDLLKKTLLTYYAKDETTSQIIEDAFQAALSEGENMLMKFKEKKTAKRYAVIYLRCLDSGYFLPLLRVFDEKDNLIFEQDLPETLDANYIGQILLNNSRIEIRPKKNVFTKELLPIKYLLS